MRFEEAPMVGRSTVAVTAESQAQLQALAGSHERGEADRARAILLSVAGWSSGRIGQAFGVREDTVRLWRMRFMQGGVAGLRTHAPPGASPVKAEAALAVAEDVLSAPVANRTNWTLRRLSRDSLSVQRMAHPLSVEVCDGLVNASVEVIGAGEGLM